MYMYILGEHEVEIEIRSDILMYWYHQNIETGFQLYKPKDHERS